MFLVLNIVFALKMLMVLQRTLGHRYENETLWYSVGEEKMISNIRFKLD